MNFEDLKQKAASLLSKDYWIEAKDNGVLDKIVWSVVVITFCLGAGGYYVSKSNRNDREMITLERIKGNFTILDTSGPNPLIVTLKEVNTNTIFENIKVAEKCAKYGDKSYIGENVELLKFTLINAMDDNDREYYFKGIEERLCQGRPFIIDASNNFYIKK